MKIFCARGRRVLTGILYSEIIFLILALPGRAAVYREHILALANRADLLQMIGKLNDQGFWMEPNDFYQPPQPADPVTIFGIDGLLGKVRVISPRRPSPNEVSLDWNAKVSSWTWQNQEQAVAILGDWPDIAGHATSMRLDDLQAKAAVSTYLKKKGLVVPDPQLTQAYTIDIDGDGRPEYFYCAQSNDDALEDNQAGNQYAVVLMIAKNKTFALASQAWYKPQDRTKGEEEVFYGARDYLRLIAFIDLKGDGHRQIFLYKAKSDAIQIDVFDLKNARLKKVLTSFKGIIY